MQLPPGASVRNEDLKASLASALGAKGPGYVPRTRHLEGDAPKYVNRLILETSPYLLQHAHNPVDWFSWGEEAFEEARSTGKPLFVSIGYATCHWCHVMEEESFEDEGTARLLNEWFVPVKVDREERPDVDSVYMASVQALTGQGGWPMSVWLDATGRPFYGGTYFPPTSRFGRPAFGEVLARIHELWEQDHGAVREQAERLSEHLHLQLSLAGGGREELPGPEVLAEGARSFLSIFDAEHGGFGRAPKFPRAEVVRLLLRHHRRTGDAEALTAVTRTLEAMHAGGIYDHVGGGFARYATDARWLVPHFEKMLYDNALLVPAYLEAWQATGDSRFASVAWDVLTWIRREMTSPEGAFWSAVDADSEGEEGRFYVWTPEEIDAVLGPERGRVVRAWYDVTEEGSFEGRSILHTPRNVEQVAADLGLPQGEVAEILDAARPLLYEARKGRVPPLTDDKVITGWNGLMISAFAVAARLLDEPEHARTAARAARFVLTHMRDGERLHRTWREGQARHPGTLEDHAAMAAGCLDLFEATADPSWLDESLRLHEVIEAEFAHPDGGWYAASRYAPDLLLRPREVQDGAIPSGASIATLTLLRLSVLTGDRRWRELAEASLRSVGGFIVQHPGSSPTLLSALDWVLDRPWEVLVVRPAGEGREDGLVDRLRHTYLPNAVQVVATEGEHLATLARRIPMLRDRGAGDGRPVAYVCTEGACRLPTSDPAELGRALEERP